MHLTIVLAALAFQLQPGVPAPTGPHVPVRSLASAPDSVLANDNRMPAGRRRGGVLRLELEAVVARWRPDADVDSMVTVMAFAESGGGARIPGPLLRVESGTIIHLSVRNSLPDSTLVVHGLRAGTVNGDTVHVRPGETREVRFTAGAAGTYLYWATTTQSPIQDRPWRDSQLTGAIVIDPPGGPVHPDERIFVITVIDIFRADTIRNKAGEDVWDLAINGRSWPHSERLQYAVGDTVRWRWLNGSYLPHPMHLHGFHFRVTAKGSGTRDTIYAPDAQREGVTEFMFAGSTYAMDWVPTRAGSWLMHCHMIPHITPFPERPDSTRHHDVHDVGRHPMEAMSGLVLGITTVHRGDAVAATQPEPGRHLRLLVQEAAADSGRPPRMGYVLQQGAEPQPDSIEVPGAPLVLVRGETAAITVVNRLREPTTVHWHGMELESVFDGVSGWSRTGSNIAPLLAPGDSFTVTFTPPRAGTFIYHTHMDEGAQLTGLYGPLLVMAPGERYDPATDLVFTIASAVEGDTVRPLTVNGRHSPPALELQAGTHYRMRLINIHPADAANVELRADSTPLSWRPRAKDGAELPSALRQPGIARVLRIGVGETYDFDWMPASPMDAELVIRFGSRSVVQRLRVR